MKKVKVKRDFDLHQMVTDKIIAKLEQGVVPWRKPWQNGQGYLPFNYVSKQAYSGLNSFLLSMEGYKSPEWLTFKQLQNAEGSILKGSKSSQVIYWSFLYFEKLPNGDKGRKLTEGKPFTRTELDSMVRRNKAIKIGFEKYYNVFNIEQTTLADKSIIHTEPKPQPSKVERIEACEKVIEAMPNKPKLRLDIDSDSAYYTPSIDQVTMPNIEQFDQKEEYYSTFFHELAHSTGHESRLDRSLKGTKGSKEYAEEELIAEMTASFLSAEVGTLEVTLDNSASYLQSWLKVLKGNKKMIFTASSKAKKAFEYIVNK